MKEKLIKDYLYRAEKRILSLEFLRDQKDYADVVREAQEVVELLLKALLLGVGLEIPKVHDVSPFIEKHLNLFPEIIKENFTEIRRISRNLRKERELAFYGAFDWIPSEEYSLEDAEKAIRDAKNIYHWVVKALQELS